MELKEKTERLKNIQNSLLNSMEDLQIIDSNDYESDNGISIILEKTMIILALKMMYQKNIIKIIFKYIKSFFNMMYFFYFILLTLYNFIIIYIY